jgi:hypothetical protein
MQFLTIPFRFYVGCAVLGRRSAINIECRVVGWSWSVNWLFDDSERSEGTNCLQAQTMSTPRRLRDSFVICSGALHDKSMMNDDFNWLDAWQGASFDAQSDALMARAAIKGTLHWCSLNETIDRRQRARSRVLVTSLRRKAFEYQKGSTA